MTNRDRIVFTLAQLARYMAGTLSGEELETLTGAPILHCVALPPKVAAWLASLVW